MECLFCHGNCGERKGTVYWHGRLTRHDVSEPIVLNADEVFRWNFYVVEPNECRTAGVHAGVLHSPPGYALSCQWDDQQRNSPTSLPTCPDCSRAIMGPYPVGDPFFGSVDDILVPAAFRGGSNVRDVGSG